jgi:hypothetical protein
MGAERKQIQTFNGSEEIELKQGNGRFNLFSKLSDIIAYIQTKINNTTPIETLSVSFNDRIYNATGTLVSVDNTNSTVSITLFSEPSNTVIATSSVYQNPANWGTGLNPVFQTSYNTTTLPTGDTTILVYLELTGDSSSAQYYRTVPIGKGNQTVYIDIDSAKL